MRTFIILILLLGAEIGNARPFPEVTHLNALAVEAAELAIFNKYPTKTQFVSTATQVTVGKFEAGRFADYKIRINHLATNGSMSRQCFVNLTISYAEGAEVFNVTCQ